MNDSGPIVIGYDGSDFADEALRKGLWLASKVGAPARIVRAWSISNAPRPATWAPGYVPPVDDFAAAVLDQLRAQTASRIAAFPNVEVSFEVPHGAAGRELLKASEDAQVIVVGTRGLGGFSGLRIGSVSGQVVEHARCDVFVTRRASGDQAPPRTFKLDQAIVPD
jgi:nucleotide-binding universal stress UspA family protein